MIHIILAEDHHIVRGGVKALLEKESNFAVSGEATNGAEVLALLEKGVPADIILVDMNMPVMGGLELTSTVSERFPASKVIILSALDHEKYVVKAFHSGANAYLLKSISPDELIFAIKHTMLHSQYICTELSKRFLDRLLQQPDTIIYKSVQDLEFSSREIEILNLIAEGFTNQEVADKLFSSKRTIENHRQSMIDKTGSRNTVALIRFAIINGII